MRNLFRSGAVFFIIAGVLLLIAAGKYLMTDNGSAVTSGGAVAMGVIMLVMGIVVRSKNTK